MQRDLGLMLEMSSKDQVGLFKNKGKEDLFDEYDRFRAIGKYAFRNDYFWFPKAVSPPNISSDFSNTRTHATVNDGQIGYENSSEEGSGYNGSYSILVLWITRTLRSTLAQTTKNMFSAIMRMAMTQTMAGGPNAAVAFMANLFREHQGRTFRLDVRTEIDDNTNPYHQYLLDTEAKMFQLRHMDGDRCTCLSICRKFLFGTVRLARMNMQQSLKLAFRQHSLSLPQLLYSGSPSRFTETSNLYSISMNDMMSLHSLLANKSLFNKSHVRGLPMLKYNKDHLCPSCQLGKSKKASHPLKTENTNTEVLNTLHMDLCGPMRTESINGKKYVLVIVDDYTRFGWVRFLRSKDETPQVIEKFIVKTQRALNATVRFVRTDNGTEFVNKTLDGWFESVGISLIETSVPRFHNRSALSKDGTNLMEACSYCSSLRKLPVPWAEARAMRVILLSDSCTPTIHGRPILNC
ncbi:retrovirus-related pol polyprotein from transposon TNT 1-94 [Tanacetum coccineum]